MPLEKAPVGSAGFGRNIATEMKAGKPVKQAVAIAYEKAGDRKDSINNAPIYEENGEFFFPKPGSKERFGPYASKAEARTAAVNAGVVADADEAILGRADATVKVGFTATYPTGKTQTFTGLTEDEIRDKVYTLKNWNRATEIKYLYGDERALKKLIKNRKDDAEADSLPPLARALAAADSMYAKALDSVHRKDAAGDYKAAIKETSDGDFTVSVMYEGRAMPGMPIKFYSTRKAAEKGAALMLSKARGDSVHRKDAERDLTGAGTTEGNYGIDGARDDARPEPLSEEDRRYWTREVRDRIQDAKAAIKSFEGRSPELAKEQKNRLKAAEETQKILSNPNVTENDIEAVWRKWKYA